MPPFSTHTTKHKSHSNISKDEIINAVPEQIPQIIGRYTTRFFSHIVDDNKITGDWAMREYLQKTGENEEIDDELLEDVKSFLITNYDEIEKLKQKFGGRKSRRSIKTNKRSQRRGTRRNRRH
jgi:hypothetical protein